MLRSFAWQHALATLGVVAFVLRAHMRIWWHVSSGSLKFALTDHDLSHFRSFAEVGACCGPPQPDLRGVTTQVVRFLLSRFTVSHPLEIHMSPDGSPSMVRWVSGLTGREYKFDMATEDDWKGGIVE